LSRIAQYRPAEKLCAWLLKPENAETVAHYAVRFLAFGLTALDDNRVRSFLLASISTRLRQVDSAALVAQILDILTENKRHHALFDEALAGVDELLSREETRQFIATEISNNVPLLKKLSDYLHLNLDRKAALRIIDIAIAKISEIRKDSDHELRRRFDVFVSDFINKLKTNDETRAKVTRIRDDILRNPALAEYVDGLWQSFHSWLEHDLRDPNSEVHEKVITMVRSLGDRLKTDTAIQSWIDEQILHAVPIIVEENRAKFGKFIEDQINGWQEKKLVLELEREIGPDLQHIRINGTVVGGLAGLVISTVTHLLR
jgi:uncharacterized membrane-anchored protein YjiN (DUF445 family)